MFEKAVVHIGTHKTGTTALQAVLRANKAQLNQASICYPDRKLIKTAFTHKLKQLAARGRADDPAALQALFTAAAAPELEAAPGCRFALLSDEDLLGAIDFPEQNALYKDAGAHVAALAQAVPAKARCWILCLRDLGDFIESCYVQRIKTGATFPFQDFLSAFDIAAMDYVDLVSRLRRALPEQDSLLVYEYSPRSINDRLLAAIRQALGPFETPNAPDVQRNKSYTAEGLELSRFGNEVISDAEDRKKLRRFLQRNFSVEPGGAKPALLTPQQRARADKTYTEAMAALSESALPTLQVVRA